MGDVTDLDISHLPFLSDEPPRGAISPPYLWCLRQWPWMKTHMKPNRLVVKVIMNAFSGQGNNAP